tara:strand:- start:1225 stop:1686 length:462 start_codon:yes stop_codon:yes gene_type:complete
MSSPKSFIEELNTSQIVIGLDFGDKNIGIAISDITYTIATPIKTLKRKSIKKDIEELKIIFHDYNVGGIVMGLPLSLNGEENISTSKVRRFAEEIKKSTDLKIFFFDERFSSDVIFKELRKNSVTHSKIKSKIDQQAASYFLQGFLDSAKNNI